MTESINTVKHCVVCNQGSNRRVWKNTSGKYVACDKHSKAEVALAITKFEAGAKQSLVEKNRRLGLTDDGKAKQALPKVQPKSTPAAGGSTT
jgi:hypothetical protein